MGVLLEVEMTSISRLLKDHGLNFRERSYVYGGTALGVVAPILYDRYVLGWSGASDGSPASEVAYWVASVIAAVPLSVVGGVIGAVAGISTVSTSRIYAGLKEKERLNAEGLEDKIGREE